MTENNLDLIALIQASLHPDHIIHKEFEILKNAEQDNFYIERLKRMEGDLPEGSSAIQYIKELRLSIPKPKATTTAKAKAK